MLEHVAEKLGQLLLFAAEKGEAHVNLIFLILHSRRKLKLFTVVEWNDLRFEASSINTDRS